MDSILSLLDLSPEQQAAVLSDRPAVVVTAGAGSGKTRTLAGRYLRQIEQGYPVRSLIAVTFTEKAAREMRNRIRGYINQWRLVLSKVEGSDGGNEKAVWDTAFVALDAARIGTIHSLCAEILRAHPAEAGVDPLFDVLEENTAMLLQTRAVEQALAWAVEDPLCVQLFGPLSEFRLRRTLAELLAKRLDAQPAFSSLGEDALRRWSDAASAWFGERLQDGEWRQALADLAAVGARVPDDKMELARLDVLAHWRRVELGLAAGDWEEVVAELVAMRKAYSSHGAKGNWPGDDLATARAAMKTLRDYHEAELKPLLGKTLPCWALDEQAAALLPGLQRLFEKCLAIYDGMKDERHALDFDDLERMTVTLLAAHPEVRERWQTDTAAVLVDEFQDTNARQKKIVYQITGFAEKIVDSGYSISPETTSISNIQYPASSLFIVGDGKQSIYRFRGADVTVFRDTQADLTSAGGQALDLDTTYRAHSALVETLNRLLAPIMGEEDDPQRPYKTPFAPLQAHRSDPRLPVRAPWLEFHLGLGDATEGRASAAAGLAQRLLELHAAGCPWKHMALLFRASTAFGVYEDALEAAGIPFVTVAGRGFYDRPEIRDLLNALTAISDPADDLAMAGLLRSPMFGLSDAALFTLRWGQNPDRGKLGFWQALQNESVLETLDPADAWRAVRARDIVAELHAVAGRQTIAYALKRLLDQTHYRAALRLAAGGERAWRNVDKLLADAHRSRLVGVSDFLEYVGNLRDVAAREGEAVTEADNAVQLMTIHKAKGLEFPIVVLADASYSGNHRAPDLLLDDALGPLLHIQDEEAREAKPLAYQLGTLRQRDMEDAEAKRLLYVAATRAEEKLLISGYTSIGTAKKDPGKLKLAGWLGWLGEVVGMDDIRLDESPTSPGTEPLAWNDANLTLYPAQESAAQPIAAPPSSGLNLQSLIATDLLPPLPDFPSPDQIDDKTEGKEADPPPRVWRVASDKRYAPAWVVGALVHKALQHWCFPDQPGFDAFMKPFARESGLVSEREIDSAVREARKLLARFMAHPLFTELNRAQRRHEIPYSVPTDEGNDSGVIDLIARGGPEEPWVIYDFKTDRLEDARAMQKRIKAKKYDRQLGRYQDALESQLGKRPQAHLVFLSVGGLIVLEPEANAGERR